MPATARIPIQIDPFEKKAFTRKAKRFGMSLSAFARSAMDNYEPKTIREEDLDRMLLEIRAGTLRAKAAIEETLSFCKTSSARIAKLAQKGLV